MHQTAKVVDGSTRSPEPHLVRYVKLRSVLAARSDMSTELSAAVCDDNKNLGETWKRKMGLESEDALNAAARERGVLLLPDGHVVLTNVSTAPSLSRLVFSQKISLSNL